MRSKLIWHPATEDPKRYDKYWCEYIVRGEIIRRKLRFDPMWGWCGDFDEYDRPHLVLDNCIERWAEQKKE